MLVLCNVIYMVPVSRCICVPSSLDVCVHLQGTKYVNTIGDAVPALIPDFLSANPFCTYKIQNSKFIIIQFLIIIINNLCLILL